MDDLVPARVGETQLDVLPVSLRLTARAVWAGAVQWGAGVVIQSRVRAPRLPLILICVLAAPRYFTSQSGTSTQTRDRCCTGGNREP